MCTLADNPDNCRSSLRQGGFRQTVTSFPESEKARLPRRRNRACVLVWIRGDPYEWLAAAWEQPAGCPKHYHLVGLYSHVPQNHLLSRIELPVTTRLATAPVSSRACYLRAAFARSNSLDFLRYSATGKSNSSNFAEFLRIHTGREFKICNTPAV